MDQKTWQQALDVYDTYGDLSIDEFTSKIDKLSLTRELRELLIELKITEEDASDYFDGLQDNLAEFIEPPVPKKLGAWSIKSLIDTGGMSSVYLAHRDDGKYRMKAAAKFIHYSGYNPVVVKRFQQEMQFLALLDHPNITRIIDTGVTEHGMPWYIMEYVDGLSITAYCNQNGFSIEQRLKLFLKVCDAVQHAHKNLVIHRDLKPSNIFVDPDGNIKLLDFGIAKAISPDAEDKRGQHLTRANQVLMTPEYASPEQLESASVSTASDVFSLGVILHELVTGHRPYHFDKINPVKMVNRMKQRPADRPSVLFRNLESKPAGIKQSRLSRELDDIILASLRFEPDRRYASAEQLGRDLKNYLNKEPVMARADSRKYRFQKFVLRNKTTVTLGALSLIILLTLTAALFWQSRIIIHERDAARTEAAISDAVREHMLFLFREAGSLAGDTEQMSARELLDKSAQVADQWLQDDPEIQRHVYAVLGEIMLALNDYSSAESLLEKVIGSETETDNPILQSTIYRDMAQVYHRRGNFEEGFNLIEQAVVTLENLPGDHRARLSDILQIRARLHRDLGSRDAAVSDLERARELAEATSSVPRPLLARAESNLGTTLLMNGNLHGAKPHFERAEELWFSLGRPESTEALSVMNNLAVVYNHMGLPAEAKSRFRKVADLRLQHYGESGALAAVLTHLGRLLITDGELDEAEEIIRRSEEMTIRFVGESTPSHAVIYLAYGELYRTRGDFEKAYEHFERADNMFESIFGEMHPYALLGKSEMVHTLRDMHGSTDHNNYTDLIRLAAETGPAANMVLSGIHCQAVRNAVSLGDLENARGHALECKQLRESLGLAGWRELEVEVILDLITLLAGDYQAEKKFLDHLEMLSDLISDRHPSLVWLREVSDTLVSTQR